MTGGGTANQLLDHIDYEAIKNNPKPFIGMSDVDVLHTAIRHETGLITFLGPDPKIASELPDHWLAAPYAQQEFLRVVVGGEWGAVPARTARTTVRPGKASGHLVGANLKALLKLAGTKRFPDLTGAILLLEMYYTEPRESLYLLEQLRQIGGFERINGLATGYVVGFEENTYETTNGERIGLADLALEVTRDYDFPILKMNEFGHRCPVSCIPLGAHAELDADAQTLIVKRPER